MKFWLSEIKIKNFLSYKDATFKDLRNYNVFIGKNNAGKSNLFKILGFLQEIAKTSIFEKSFLFDESNADKNEITLTFELSTTFRKEIFEILYEKGYLKRVFITHEGEQEYLKRDQWNKKEKALDWLCNQGFYNFIKFTLGYYKKYNNIIIREIKVIHNDFEKEQTLYEGREKDEQIQAVIHGYTNVTGISENFEHFFSDFNSQNAPDLFHQSIHSIFRMPSDNLKSLKEYNPILKSILYDLLMEFFNSIYIIPYNRQFRGFSDRIKLLNTILDLNGENFVKFIDMKISDDKKEWVDELNEELKEYFTDMLELTKIVDHNDQSVFILKVPGLLSKLKKENMGVGILNIAFFLTWIKILHRNKFLFIEEPELFIYLGLQIKILEKFLDVSDNIQIFVTTHSKYFLSPNKEICSVYFIQKINNGSIPYKIPKEDFPEIYKNLEIVLDEYEQDQIIIYNDSFWVKFIKKAMNRVEDSLWDFKQILEMWKISNVKVKQEKIIDFCEDVASFANLDGGIILLGVTNIIPRKIVGLEKIEERKNSIPIILTRFTNLTLTSCITRDLLIMGENDEEYKCLIIVIPQTQDVIEVRGLDQKISYPIRVGAGKERVNYKKILEAKKNLSRNNFKFIHKLLEFSKS